MAVPVWTYSYRNLKVRRVYDRQRLDLGSGFIKTKLAEIPHSRADGMGAVASKKGANIFEVEVPAKTWTDFTPILAFLQARVEANDEAFYFYRADENQTVANWNGSNTTGRYLVKYLGDLEHDLLILRTLKFATFVFEEVFES